MDEFGRQLATLPHHRQATVLSIPGGYEARELAARAVLAMEEKGIGL